MTFDLGRALRKKEEMESARWMDFVFRRLARAARMLADMLGVDPAEAAACVAREGDATLPESLAARAGAPAAEVHVEYARCLAAAHAELVAERGDPAAHSLA